MFGKRSTTRILFVNSRELKMKPGGTASFYPQKNGWKSPAGRTIATPDAMAARLHPRHRLRVRLVARARNSSSISLRSSSGLKDDENRRLWLFVEPQPRLFEAQLPDPHRCDQAAPYSAGNHASPGCHHLRQRSRPSKRGPLGPAEAMAGQPRLDGNMPTMPRSSNSSSLPTSRA